MKIVKSDDVVFKFVGDRNYVQATTLIHSLVEILLSWGYEGVRHVNGTFHKSVAENGRFDLLDVQDIKGLSRAGYLSVFSVTTYDRNLIVGLRGNGVPILRRIADDEEMIVQGHEVNIDEKWAAAQMKPNRRLLNGVTTLNKKLHAVLFESTGFGQWFLAKCDVDWQQPELARACELKLTLKGKIGSIGTKTRIEVDSEKRGYIYFAREALDDRN